MGEIILFFDRYEQNLSLFVIAFFAVVRNLNLFGLLRLNFDKLLISFEIRRAKKFNPIFDLLLL